MTPSFHIHANTASVAQLAPQVARRMAKFAEDMAQDDFYLTSYAAANGAREEVYQRLADLLGCDASSLSLHSSTSAALAKAVLGLPRAQRRHVALPAGSYASARALADRLAQEGATVTTFGRPSGYVGLEDLENLPSKPDVIILEWVNYRTGCVCPLDLISRWCREQDVLLAVDGVQAIGAVPLVFDTDRIDFMAGAAHKWLGGPEGVGFLYCSPRHGPTLSSPLPGYASLKDLGGSSQRLTFHNNGRQLETGTLSTISIIGFAAALSKLKADGYHQRILAIQKARQVLCASLSSYAAIRIVNEPSSDGTSGIISFVLDGIETQEFVNNLAHAGVTAKNRDGVVRLSAGYDLDVQKLVQRLENVMLVLGLKKGSDHV